MKWGFRTPPIRTRISARTSVKRIIRHSLGVKVPRSLGWLTNPRKAAYNQVYRRTTFGLGKGCLVMALMVIILVVLTAYSGCKGPKPPGAEPPSRSTQGGNVATSAPPSAAASSQAAQRRVHVFITGQVQGVGFRAFTQEQAQRLEVTGFVRNLADGRVELVVEGPPSDVEKLIAKVRHGPPSARVDRLDCTDEPPSGEYTEFTARY